MPSPEAYSRARSLLALGLESAADDPPPAPERFGDYELLRLIGEGSSGTVHEARRSDGQIVALKRVRVPSSPAAVQRFNKEAKLTRSLHHDNVIDVLEIGEVDGSPFYTMPLLTNGTLVDWQRRSQAPPKEIADVVAKIAKAVDHAHVGGVLHRDLKPANILMKGGEPYVADFGLAKSMDHGASVGQGTMVGTLDYMAPEQALGDPDELTPAADVYSLGVVLYELLTGNVPVRGATVREFLQRLWSADPILPLRKSEPGLSRSLENICLKCLENDPRLRYGSAAELASDLERAREGESTEARAPSLALRTARWIRRHPRGAVSAAGAAFLTLVVTVVLSLVWQAQDRVLDTNAFIASGQAGAALFQLREYGDHVVEASHDPLVHEILAAGTLRRIDPELKVLAGGFDSLFVMNSDGRILAQWPTAAEVVFHRTFTFRDYFRGARKLAETGTPGAYVARAFRSESHGVLEFAISVPVMEQREGKVVQVGLVAGTLSAKSAFGAVRMEDAPAGGGRIITALVGPRGNDRDAGPDAPMPADFTFLVHPGMDRGAEYALRTPAPETLREAFGLSAPPGQQFSLQYIRALQLPNYHDPIPGFDGEWLTALAPVGKTGFVVLVQTRKDAAFPWLRAWRGSRWLRVATVAGGGAALLLICAALRARSRRARSR